MPSSGIPHSADTITLNNAYLVGHFKLKLPLSYFFKCPFFEFKNFKVVYKRYASLFFIIGVDSDEASYQ